jgi:hypothetical protein
MMIEICTGAEVKEATATVICKVSGNVLLHVFEKWVGCCKKCIACEGPYFEKETVPDSHESADSE